MQVLPGPGEGHVKEAALLLHTFGISGRHVGWEHAVGGVDQMHDPPLAPLAEWTVDRIR